MSLKVGDAAPRFDMTSSDGKRLRLEDYLGKKNLIVYFYPADNTPVCTAEACGFRDMYEDLMSKDTEIIGISADDDASHKGFASKHRVPFPLVADTDRTVAKSFDAAGGALNNLRGVTSRVTYVIDKKGQVAGVFDSMFRASKHLDGVKAVLAGLQ